MHPIKGRKIAYSYLFRAKTLVSLIDHLEKNFELWTRANTKIKQASILKFD